MDDLEIIELYFCRDEKALTETARKYGNYCYTVAFSVLNSMEDSKETVNDTYLELWNTIPPERPTVLSAFISKITRRLAIGRWRKNTAVKRGGGEFEATLDELSECISNNANVEKIVEGKLIVSTINEFLKKLPDTERNVFICRYWYADSVKSVAKQFGFSESKVKSMLMRTRTKLKQKLAEEGLL